MLVTIALTAALSACVAQADTASKRIALSNNYAGNSWRQAVLKSWNKVTGAAVKGGVVAVEPTEEKVLHSSFEESA